MTKVERDQMYKDIETHGNKLNVIFDTGLDPVVLCKKLNKLEKKANKLAENYCNGRIDSYDMDIDSGIILDKVKVLLRTHATRGAGLKGDQILFNRDPRGYALKINDDYVRGMDIDIYRDFGGYGILAPDFTPN